MSCPICGQPLTAPWVACGAAAPAPVVITGNVISLGRAAMPYTAKERLYTTLDGKVVKEDDPNAAFLLATEGSELSDEDAKKYGLTAEKAEAEAKAAETPPATKAKTPQSNKGA